MAKKSEIAEEAWPLTSTLPRCTEAQTAEYFSQARKFIKATRFYQSMAGDAACAVAEYIAYQEGYTIRDWKRE